MSRETDFERGIVRVAGDLPGYPLPQGLRETILDRLPTVERRKASHSRRRLTAGALAIAAIVAICVIFAIVFRAQDPAAEALALMQQANTWHMSGWKMRHLERVDWEVWGRRKPFFFYENQGGHITYDDGRKRIEVIPQSVYNGTDSIVVITTSDPNAWGNGMEYTFRVSDWRKGNRPKRITAQDYIFETTYYGGPTWETGLVRGKGLATQSLLYANKRTLYPNRYQELITVDKDLPPVVVQDVKIELNKDLPQNIVAPAWPANYVVMDTTVPHDTSKVPKDNVSYKDGFSAQLTPLAMDKNGDVLFRARGWFGNTRLCSTSFAQFHADMPVSEWALPKSGWPYHDDLARDYVMMTMWPEPPFPSPTGDELLLFSPAGPLKPRQSLPKRMTISLSVSAYIDRSLAERDVGWTVSLAGVPVVSNFDNFWAQKDPDWREHWPVHLKSTFPAGQDNARSLYWMWQSGLWEGTHSRPNRAYMLLMIKCDKRAIADSVPGSPDAYFYKTMLEGDYMRAHHFDKSIK